MSIQLPPRRIAAIHDLSCFGRCALTVIMPTLSVMGYQVVPVPTALLSTHTGGFKDLHFRDLTPDMEQISDHFSRLGVGFDAIYSGFLGSEEQIETVCRFLDRFSNVGESTGERPLVLVDPVMGDDGEPYSTYTPALMQGMKRLSRRAQLITPNLTEACFLTDTPYRDPSAMAPEEALAFGEMLLCKLEEFGVCRVVITGIFLSDGTLANLGRDADGKRFCVRRPLEAHSYPGTGDLFACVLLGSLLDGMCFADACARAADFIATVIGASAQISTPEREGVALEKHLWRLCPISEG